ncbi:MAG TPA: hypothetical protein VKB38_11655 [Terracidiphilus sp.]|nr:hypothetical protein [Terracidiphilus sp.]
MSDGSRNRNLVVVRAGRNSLHPQWLEGATERSWDLIVSVYDAAAHFDAGEGVRVEIRPGGKWDGIHGIFTESDLLDRYDYIWLPDDDIAAKAKDIDATFAAMRRYELEVAQPSLTHDSYYSLFPVMSCPGFTLRYLNFVEVMVPCVRASLLRQVLDDFRTSMSGRGMDWIWCRLAPDPHYKAAILDSIAVRHTRPVGKFLRGTMASRGKTPEDEESELNARYNVGRHIPPVVYAGIGSSGRRLEGCVRLGFAMAWGYLSVLREFMRPMQATEKVWQLIRRQTLQRPDLSQLRRMENPPRPNQDAKAKPR